MARFRAGFGDLAAPRSGNAQRHDPLAILSIALAATLGGAEGCLEMALCSGVPRRRCCGVFCAWRAASRATTPSRGSSGCAFEAGFGRFVAACAAAAGNGGVVAVDGKTTRPRARSPARRPPPRATACSPSHSLPPAAPRSCAPTGRSKTAATGCSTWCSTRTPRPPARTTPQRTSPDCAASSSTCRAPIPRQDQTRRLGRRLPAPNPRRSLMRLPWACRPLLPTVHL
jgi:hypothetical protein